MNIKLYIVCCFIYIKSLFFTKINVKNKENVNNFLDCRFLTLNNLPKRLLDLYEDQLEEQHVQRIAAPIFCVVGDWVFVDTSQEKISKIITQSQLKDLELLSKEFRFSFQL